MEEEEGTTEAGITGTRTVVDKEVVVGVEAEVGVETGVGEGTVMGSSNGMTETETETGTGTGTETGIGTGTETGRGTGTENGTGTDTKTDTPGMEVDISQALQVPIRDTTLNNRNHIMTATDPYSHLSGVNSIYNIHSLLTCIAKSCAAMHSC